MSEEIYLSLNCSEFDERKKEGIEEDKANGGDGKSMCFPNLGWIVDTNNTEFRDGELYMSGSILDTDLTDFGYLSTSIKLDLDTVISIIEFYRSKLGKLKTVLEATK